MGMMTTEATPPLPTRQDELNYLDWLEKSFSEDKVLTIHPKLYAASPYRNYFRYWKELHKEYRKTFALNFLASVVLSWPLII
jgi:hypothetical protein